MNPRVTVLMPVFNREAFVGDAIASVLAQDFDDFELVIVDDGSTDRTAEVLRTWAQRDPRIVVITAPRNLGIAEAPNLGLRHAGAEYVARLDSDDLMTPGRLAAQYAAIDAHPNVVLVSSAYELMDREGRSLGTWNVDEPHEVIVHLLGYTNIVGGGGHVMFRRSEVLAVGGYDAAFPSSEDYDLWVRLLRRGRILTLPSLAMRQRDHEGRATIAFAARKRTNWTAIMRKSLEPCLGRPVRDDEIAALITVWRHDGATGMASTASRTMQEAFTRFCRDHADRELRRRVRRRIARQWMEGARRFADLGNRLEVARFRFQAVRWRLPR